MKIIRIATVVSIITIAGCSTVAPQYSPSIDNIQSLKNANIEKVSVGKFSAGDNKVNELTIRGGSFQSPVNASYVEYLQKALEQELYDANQLNKNSDIKISGVLLKNDIDASGMNVGTAVMDAEFSVHDTSSVRYKKTHSANIEWPSSFIGGIAIPRAIKEYPRVVQELLGKLYADPEFTKALK